MKQDEIRELMNDKFTEITQEEYRELGRLEEFKSWCGDGNIYHSLLMLMILEIIDTGDLGDYDFQEHLYEEED